MTALTSMTNIGREMEKKLISIGILTPAELRKLGSKEAFFRLKLQYPNVCLVHLYTLEGAVSDMQHNALPENVKKELKAYSDGLK